MQQCELHYSLSLLSSLLPAAAAEAKSTTCSQSIKVIPPLSDGWFLPRPALSPYRGVMDCIVMSYKYSAIWVREEVCCYSVVHTHSCAICCWKYSSLCIIPLLLLCLDMNCTLFLHHFVHFSVTESLSTVDRRAPGTEAYVQVTTHQELHLSLSIIKYTRVPRSTCRRRSLVTCALSEVSSSSDAVFLDTRG